MNKEREKLIKSFLLRRDKYKNSIRLKVSGVSRIKRFLINTKQFGFSYIRHLLINLYVVNFPVDFRAKLFTGRDLILPGLDRNSSSLSLYGILPNQNERKLTLWILKHLKDTDIFYDIGAHMGFYSVVTENILKQGRVYAFEANRKLCRYLSNNFKNSSNVKVECSAVANSTGETDFYEATNDKDSSESSRFPVFRDNIVMKKINSITVDEYVARGNKPPTVIKLDIEGGEHDALIGAVNTIRDNKPIIIMEIWGGKLGEKYHNEAVQMLTSLGYRIFSIERDGTTSSQSISNPVQMISDDITYDNFLFLNK